MMINIILISLAMLSSNAKSEKFFGEDLCEKIIEHFEKNTTKPINIEFKRKIDMRKKHCEEGDVFSCRIHDSLVSLDPWKHRELDHAHYYHCKGDQKAAEIYKLMCDKGDEYVCLINAVYSRHKDK